MLSDDAEKALLASVDDLRAVKQFISQSLVQKSDGETYYYDNVCKQLRDRDDPEMVYKVMISLASYASVFTSDPDCHRELVASIYSYDWKSDRKISIAFVNLVGCMVSANATFLIPSFQMLALSLVPTESDLAALNNGVKHKEVDGGDTDKNTNGETENGEHALVADLQQSHIEDLRERQNRVHRTLQGLIKMAPSGQDELYPVLARVFPHKRFSKGILSEFVAQVLRITEYLPSLQDKALDLILSRSLEIDVEIVIEDTGEVKIVEEYRGEEEEDMFAVDDIGGPPGDNGGAPGGGAGAGVGGGRPARSGSVSNERGQRIPAAVTEMADKLDAVLYVLIEYINRQFALGDAHVDRLLHHLLGVFEGRVLFTYRSKFVQFLYFYTAQLSRRFALGFCQRLVRVFLEAGAGALHGAGAGRGSGLESSVALTGTIAGLPPQLGGLGPLRNPSGGTSLGGIAGAMPEEYRALPFNDNDDDDDDKNASNGNNMKVQSAVLYLASYLSRARFLPVETVLGVLETLIQWADRYVTQARAGALAPTLTKAYASAARLGQTKAEPERGSGSQNGAGTDITTTATATSTTSTTTTNNNNNSSSLGPATPGRKGSKRSLSITDYRDKPTDDDDDDDDRDRDRDRDRDEAKRPSIGGGGWADQGTGQVGLGDGGVYMLGQWGARRAAETAVARHETFYTCAQACCYIACFYGVELAEDIKTNKPLVLAAWERVLCSRLSPLKYCLQSIRSEFLRLADECDMFSGYFWASLTPEVLLDAPRFAPSPGPGPGMNTGSSSNTSDGGDGDEDKEDNEEEEEEEGGGGDDHPGIRSAPRLSVQPGIAAFALKAGAPLSPRTIGAINRAGVNNHRGRRDTSSGNNNTNSSNNTVIGTGANPLESFFPFDPCLLEIMHGHIEKHYRRWKGLPGVDVDKDYPFRLHSGSRSGTLTSMDLDQAGVVPGSSTEYTEELRDDGSDGGRGGRRTTGVVVPNQDQGGGAGAAASASRDRGATITSLASSISSVMSLVEGQELLGLGDSDAAGTGSDAYGLQDAGSRLMSKGAREAARTASLIGSDDSASGGVLRYMTRTASMGTEDDDGDASVASGEASDDGTADEAGGDDDGDAFLKQAQQGGDKQTRRPRLYSVGSTDSW